MAYNPLTVTIAYTGNDKLMTSSEVIKIENVSAIKTLSTILATKPTAKNFDSISAKAKKILAVFLASKKFKTVDGLLSDMEVRVISNPLLQDGKDRPMDRFTEFSFTLSSLLAITNLHVRVTQRPTWVRVGKGEVESLEQDYASLLG